MARAPRRPPKQQAPAPAPEPRALRSSTAAARSSDAPPLRPPPVTRGSRKRAASDADASGARAARPPPATPATAPRGKQRRVPPPLPQVEEPEEELLPTSTATAAASSQPSPPPSPAAAKAPTPTLRRSGEKKRRASSSSSDCAASPQLQALVTAPAGTPPTLPKRKRSGSELPTPEPAPPAERGGGKRPARRSFGSDGSSALGGSERSPSSRALSAPSDDLDDDAPLRPRGLGDPDVVLHVDSCSFAVHASVVERLSPRLRQRLAAARREPEPRGEITRFSAAIEHRVDHFGRPALLPLRCSLRRVDRARNRVAAHGSEMALSSSPAQCPLDAARAASSSAATAFTAVRCLAHSTSRTSVASGASTSGSSPGQRSDARASPREALRGIHEVVADSARRANAGGWSTTAAADSDSEDKENRALNSAQRQRAAQRIQSQRELLAEVEQEHERQSREICAQRFNSNEMEDDDADLRLAPRSRSAAPAAEKVHIEWRQTTPAAVATVLEFAYSGEVRMVDPSVAFDVAQLNEWLRVSGELTHESLKVAVEHVTLEQWVQLCITCSLQRDEVVRNSLVERLLDTIRTLPHSRNREVLAKTQLEGLGVIMDPDLLGRIVMCLQNHVLQVGVWRNLVLMLDIWGKRKLGRLLYDPPLTLLELHREFASWDPFVTLPATLVSGESYYVRPKTLFQFGEYAFQVRFEMDSAVLVQWRVMKEPSDPREDAQIRASDPKFLLRGELKVVYRRSRGDARHEEIVSLRYAHSVHEYGIWKPLVRAPSTPAPAALQVSLVDVRLAESLASQSETEASQHAALAAAREDAPEFMRAEFTGRFFVWGHRLSALYHYLAGRSAFYSAPTGAFGELEKATPLEKMRRSHLDTLVLVLQSDRLHVPGGETTLVKVLTALCFEEGSAAGRYVNFAEVPAARTLFGCVRWRYVDEAQILQTLRVSPRKYLLYELVLEGLGDPVRRFPRRTPDNESENPYRECTTLVEFVMNAGDDGFSPSQYAQGTSRTPSSEEQ